VAGDGALPLQHTDKYSVFHTGTINISPGELIRIIQNGKSADGAHRLNNGSTFTVEGFTPKGDIRLTNGWTIKKDFGHLAYGYALTSQASQGKTVDRAFVGVSSVSYPASSAEMMYVASSRARQQVLIFTDDKRALLEAVRLSADRLSATEFVAAQERSERAATIRRLQHDLAVSRQPELPHRAQKEMTYER
jgi:hypothetical protein